jgi:hypothetical protein
MTKTILTTTIILALGLAATSAQAEGGNNLTAGTNQSEIALLLPAIQAAREPSSRSSSTSQSSSDPLEAEWRKFFQFLDPIE